MTRTPDEVKKGLYECAILKRCSTECPYRIPGVHDCADPMMRDALALIQQLQAENAEKDARIRQLEAERDAAVEDLKACVTEAAQGDDFDCCFACKYNNEYGGCDRPHHTIEACGVEDFDNKWEWRGVQKEG